jgi:hypothetical protein
MVDLVVCTSVTVSHFCYYLAEFRDTWKFVNNRIKDALDLKKTLQEVSKFCAVNIPTLFLALTCRIEI